MIQACGLREIEKRKNLIQDAVDQRKTRSRILPYECVGTSTSCNKLSEFVASQKAEAGEIELKVDQWMSVILKSPRSIALE